MVLEIYGKLMRDFLEDRKQVDPDRILEIRYEDLVENPIQDLELIYQRFSFPGFQDMKPVFTDYLNSIGDHKTDSYTMSQKELDRVMEHVGFAMKHWNYDMPDNLEVV